MTSSSFPLNFFPSPTVADRYRRQQFSAPVAGNFGRFGQWTTKEYSLRKSGKNFLPANLTAFWILVAILLLFSQTLSVSGGMCWSSMSREGLCKEVLNVNVSKEECCKSDSVYTAWSDQDLDDGSLFFWRVLGDGVPCKKCKDTCDGVKCDPDKKCIMRDGKPKCICWPQCKRVKDKVKKGPVCGTDGRSYKSLCRLKKRACRTKDTTLTVNYYGLCQSSCKNVQCGQGKYCVQDQNLSAHCVKCSHYCIPKETQSSQRVCGADRITYQSICHLNEAACRKGRSIPVAYKGKCKANATCKKVRCWEKQKCLIEKGTGYPRCTSCSECPNRAGGNLTVSIQEMERTICGSNNQTYSSWCSMIRDSCSKGYVIETKHGGACAAYNR